MSLKCELSGESIVCVLCLSNVCLSGKNKQHISKLGLTGT